MQTRKKTEIKHYDNLARSNTGFSHPRFLSFKFCENYLRKKCQGKKVLDYGCGTGIHAKLSSDFGADVIGIDLSKKSLEIARKQAPKAKFLQMDCENMNFPDNYFDIIWDGGTFSSLDIKKALPELARVIKPNGFILGIETFGHNPIFNLKRKLNVWRGIRTQWAADHIFKKQDLELAKQYFNKIQTNFFHLTLINYLDKFLLKLPILQKYAFKIVFILSEPKKFS